MNTQRIVRPFGAQSSAAEVMKGTDLAGKRAIDLATARHPQIPLAIHFNGQPLNVDHGAPLRLLVSAKLG